VLGLVKNLGWSVVNADMTILAQSPRMAPHINAMRSRLAALLEVELDAVNVKASTTEGMGFVGRKEGLETHAVVLLSR
jgi:2-C-methyl-D-erythritol 2,4-cyclodiphosphate synthase